MTRPDSHRFVRRLFRVIVCAVLGGALSVAMVGAATAQQQAQFSDTVLIGTFNIEWYPFKSYDNWRTGTRATDEDLLYAEVFERYLPALLGVQEVCDPERFKQFLNEKSDGRYDFLWAPDGGSQKVGMVYDTRRVKVWYHRQWLDLAFIPDRDRAVFHAFCEIFPDGVGQGEGGFDFHFFVVHLKSGVEPDQYAKRLGQWYQFINLINNLDQPDEDMIVVGDLNCYTATESNHFEQFELFLQTTGFYLATKNSPGSYCYRGQPSLIDHILVSHTVWSDGLDRSSPVLVGGPMSEGQCSQFSRQSVWAQKISDHCPVFLRFFTVDRDEDIDNSEIDLGR